jgi:hypothetical protein
MSFIVNKSGTVHSIPHEWLREKLESGYRKASQDEIDGYYSEQGLKDAPKVADVDKAYNAYERSLAELELAQSTTIGPRPGDVDVRMTQPGDPGFIVGNDGMRQVPSRINPNTINATGGAAATSQGFGEQDAHAYEAVVPEVTQAAVQNFAAVPVEQVAQMRAADSGEAAVPQPTSVDGPAPAGTAGAPGVVANAAPASDAKAADKSSK